MSKKKGLKQQSDAIDDMQSVVSAMKSLASMESKKLSRYLADQGKAASSVREAAGDFLSFHPFLSTATKTSRTILLAIGADRGFCGNFNEQVLEAVKQELKINEQNKTAIIAVGERLGSKLETQVELLASVTGATFAEEVPAVLSRVLQIVRKEMENNSATLVKLKILGHQQGSEEVCTLEPLAELHDSSARYSNAPHLTLSPEKFFRKLMDQYFQIVLCHAFYSSLMAESQKRLMHLDTALQRLERNSSELKRHYHQARQEEITEEIEILIMNIPNDQLMR